MLLQEKGANGCGAGINIKQMPQEQCQHRHRLCAHKNFITDVEESTFKNQ